MRGTLVLAGVIAVLPMAAAASAQTLDVPAQETPHSPAHKVTHPTWRKMPTGAEMEAFYPKEAAREGISGKVVMQCGVAREGTLYDCSIVSETPPDMGFGAAALKLAPFFEMTPKTVDGEAVSGGEVRIPVMFNPHPPAAEGASWFGGLRTLILALVAAISTLL